MDGDPGTVGIIPRYLFSAVGEEQSLLWIRSFG